MKIRSISRFPITLLIKVILLLVLIGALIWGWHLVRNPNFMPIQNIKVQAKYEHLDQDSLAKIISPYVTHQGLVSVNVAAIKAALLQRPWIENVYIKRIWPNTLEINITEQQAFAYWNDNALLNVQGEIFAPPKKTFPPGLPSFQGPNDQEFLIFQQYHAWNNALASLNLSIQELDLNQRLSWQMVLSNKIIVVLGGANVTERFKRFLQIYPKALAAHATDIKKIDLRYPDGIAVEWQSNVKPPTITANS
jgi:cell division protein FtsQ